MSNPQSGSSHLERAKTKTKLKPTRSAEELKKELRQKFHEKMKLFRSKSVDMFRQVLDDIVENNPFNSVEELKRIINQMPQVNFLLNDNEVVSIMQEVQDEINQVQLEKEAGYHDQMLEMETADTADRHIKHCALCEIAYTDETLCSDCKNFLHLEFRL